MLSLLPLALIVIALCFYATGAQSGAGSTGLAGQAPPTLSQIKDLLLLDTLQVPQLWVGALGLWGLGWLDTALPAVVWTVMTALFAAVISRAVAHSNRRKVIALAIGFAALWGFPLVLLVQTQAVVGAYVQPRYVLPVLILFAAVALQDATPISARIPRVVTVVALTLVYAVSLNTNIRRYVTGTDIVSPNLDTHVEWWWSFAPAPMALWGIGSVAFALALLVLLRRPRDEIQAAGPVAIAAPNSEATFSQA